MPELPGTTDPSFVDAFQNQPDAAVVEGDRFCGHCGYNLRHQAVRVEPQTRLALVRCPECGRFEPANDAIPARVRWLHRLAGPGLVLWALLLLAIAFTIGAFLFGMHIAYLEERVRHVSQSTPAGTVWEATLRPIDSRQAVAMALLIAGTSLACGFVMTTLATILLPHWRRAGYVIRSVSWPAAAWLLTALVIALDAPRGGNGIYTQALFELLALPALAAAAGLLAVFIGRPVARLIARLLVPPRLREPLAYLWLADGKRFLLSRREPRPL